MNKEPMVSVIVPIYNVEKYLKRCIDSILNQTYKNLEIILVDDGSPDKCPEICDEYAKKDDRIIVIHNKNGGVSSARNAGLDITKENISDIVLKWTLEDNLGWYNELKKYKCSEELREMKKAITKRRYEVLFSKEIYWKEKLLVMFGFF